MTGTRSMYVYVISAFLFGFGLGGVSLHVVTAEGLFGLKDSVAQIGTSLVEMQKNVDALQNNMNTIKQAKDKLSTLPSGGGAMDAIKNFGK